STFATLSQNQTPPQTMTPAVKPISAADQGATKAQGAVIATSPASMPLQDIEISGLPEMNAVNAIAATAPKTAAVAVCSMLTAMRRSVAPSVEPSSHPPMRNP